MIYAILKFFEIYVSELISFLEAVCLDILDHLFESFREFLEVLLIEEDLVLVIGKMAVTVYLALAFCDRQVVIVAFCGLDVKEVCTLSSSYRF